jgi:hypothetical protein
MGGKTMLSKNRTLKVTGIALMVFAGVAVATVASSWAQDSSASAAGTRSPLLQYGLSLSGMDTRASAEMLAVRQERDGSGIITTTRYHERVSASGDIDKFIVSFHYKSLPAASDTSGRVQSILDSPSIFGASPLGDFGFSSETPLPWYAQ